MGGALSDLYYEVILDRPPEGLTVTERIVDDSEPRYPELVNNHHHGRHGNQLYFIQFNKRGYGPRYLLDVPMGWQFCLGCHRSQLQCMEDCWFNSDRSGAVGDVLRKYFEQTITSSQRFIVNAQYRQRIFQEGIRRLEFDSMNATLGHLERYAYQVDINKLKAATDICSRATDALLDLIETMTSGRTGWLTKVHDAQGLVWSIPGIEDTVTSLSASRRIKWQERQDEKLARHRLEGIMYDLYQCRKRRGWKERLSGLRKRIKARDQSRADVDLAETAT